MQAYLFGPFGLDLKQRVLRANGCVVGVQGKQFDLLAFLLANRDRVCGKDEIVAHVWQGRTMAENNLAVQMSMLRRALAEHGGERLIIYQNGRGYQFVGEVTEESERRAPPPITPPPPATDAPPPAPPAPGGRAWRGPVAASLYILVLVLAGVGVWLHFATPAITCPRLSIAVLPFRNLGPDRSQDFMADAVTDDLTTDLSHIPGSTVIARESSDKYRGQGLPTAEIGRALNVRYLLEGSILAEDGAYHINAQLIEAATGAHLGARRFDTQFTHIADVRSEIVRRIASDLDAKLTDIEGRAAAHDRPDDSDTLGLFYRSRSLMEHQDSPQAFATAQHLLEQAISQRPDFAGAYAQLGLTLVQKIRSTDDADNAQDLVAARAAISRALELSPEDPVAWAADARLRETNDNCAAAELSANHALKLEPNNIDALSVLAKCTFMAGQLDAAADAAATVLRLNPEGHTNKPRYLMLAEVRLLQGRPQEAIDLANQALAGDPEPEPGEASNGRPDFGRLVLMAAYEMSGEHERSRALYAAYARVWPNHSVWRVSANATRRVAGLPGYKHFMAALASAGMPRFVDEHEDDHVAAPTVPHGGLDFDPTPTSIPGAGTLDTTKLQTLIQTTHPAIIDVGRGAAVIHGAAWRDPGTDADDDYAFTDQVLSGRAKSDPTKPIVVMGTGTSGFGAYDAALHIAKEGYAPVFWYRGGEEAWVAAGLPAEDRRPQ